jgi:hypothetical protein
VSIYAQVQAGHRRLERPDAELCRRVEAADNEARARQVRIDGVEGGLRIDVEHITIELRDRPARESYMMRERTPFTRWTGTQRHR